MAVSKTKSRPFVPDDHQRQAIDKVVKGFDGGDRGQLIMACGTGKTLAALFINEKLASRNRIRPAEPLASCRRRTGVRRLHKVDARRQL